MNTYIVLLRGVNVGGRNILPMKELAALLATNGFEEVQTYIQSGNIVLKSANRPETAIASLIENQFGFSPETLALTAQDFVSAIESNPFPREDSKAVHFYFCAGKPIPDAERIERYEVKSERYYVCGKVIYLYAPDGIARSRFIANIEACFATKASGRNLNTVQKLREILDTRT